MLGSLHNSCGIADDRGAAWHIRQHDGSRSNLGIRADYQMRHDDGIGTDREVISDAGPPQQNRARRGVPPLADNAIVADPSRIIDDARITDNGTSVDDALSK